MRKGADAWRSVASAAQHHHQPEFRLSVSGRSEFGERAVSGGILAGLNDPKLMAQLRERERVAKRVAEQMGVSLQEARWALEDFETNLCHCGHTLH
jgi:hypothetical protein